MDWAAIGQRVLEQGPLAMFALVGCGVLWRALSDERKGRIDDLKALISKRDD